MRGFSKAVIAGNLTRDPELRTTPAGANVCSFTVAVNRMYKNSSGEQVEETAYVDCSAWGKSGELIAQYIHKGDPLLVSGRLAQRFWGDKTTGAKRSKLEIVVEDFNFISTNNNGSESRSSSASAKASDATESVSEDEVPDEAGEIDLSEVPF